MAVSRRTIFDLIKIIDGNTKPGYMIGDFDMTWAEELRARLKARGHKTTVTAIFLKAIGVAQQWHPDSRTEILPFGRQVTYENIVAGFTVERMINGQPTVLLGEIADPHSKSIVEIAEELRPYGTEPIDSLRPLYLQNFFSKLPWFLRSIILYIGRSFPLQRLKCQRATSGLTSLGKLEVDALFCPCLCTATFGIGTMEERPVVKDGKVIVAKTMTVTLNYNLKAMDPVSAARFAGDVKHLMEGGLSEWIVDTEEVSTGENRRELVGV